MCRRDLRSLRVVFLFELRHGVLSSEHRRDILFFELPRWELLLRGGNYRDLRCWRLFSCGGKLMHELFCRIISASSRHVRVFELRLGPVHAGSGSDGMFFLPIWRVSREYREDVLQYLSAWLLLCKCGIVLLELLNRSLSGIDKSELMRGLSSGKLL